MIARLERGRWAAPSDASVTPSAHDDGSDGRLFDRWQTAKGLLVATGLFVIFLVSDWPRELVALGGAGLLLMSRRLHSRDMLGLVDWQLLVLFGGLFVVNGALEQSGLTARAVESLAAAGIDAREPVWLFGLSAALSNLVSNVPAVMLLLPAAAHPLAGPVLALASTLAGNLIVVGSIANIIVVGVAAAHGIAIDWRTHARLGVPVTVVTLVIAALGLWIGAELAAVGVG